MRSKLRILLLGIASFVVLLMPLVGPAPGAAEPLPTNEALADRILGDPQAPITIIEYSSLTCPHCADFHRDTLPRLKEEYLDTGKAKLIFRDYPTQPADRAIAAAMLARCARPERYFGFLEMLFRSQVAWRDSADPIAALAQVGLLGGLTRADFDTCLANRELFEGIRQIQSDGRAEFGIQSTPTFIIEGEMIEGAESYEKFDEILRPLAD